MIACGIVAHLAACKFLLQEQDCLAARDRIRISLATLGHYEEIWPRARKIINELKLIARTVMAPDSIK